VVLHIRALVLEHGTLGTPHVGNAL
jgi:hypothetical protein